MANGFQGPPAVDFYSMLSGLGDTLQANAALKQKQQINAVRRLRFPISRHWIRARRTMASRL
jgi:hypothetical protein